MVAQPAEEVVDGARAMLADGLYSRFPKPDFALALHCRADGPIGTVQYCSGPTLASSTSISMTIRGKGGHGAWPHRTVDPIVLAALVIVDLQTIVSREIEPGEPAVVTVGSIHGGTKHNIIPDEVKLQLTLRSFSEPVRQQLIAGIKRRAIVWRKPIRPPSRPFSSRKVHRRRSTRPPWSSESCRRSSRRWARPTLIPRSPSWGRRTLRFTVKGMYRSACSGWAHSAPSGSRRLPRKEKRRPPFTPRNITPNRGPASPPAFAP